MLAKAIAENGPLTVSELARSTGIPSENINKALPACVKSGYFAYGGHVKTKARSGPNMVKTVMLGTGKPVVRSLPDEPLIVRSKADVSRGLVAEAIANQPDFQRAWR